MKCVIFWITTAHFKINCFLFDFTKEFNFKKFKSHVKMCFKITDKPWVFYNNKKVKKKCILFTSQKYFKN